MVAAVVVGLAGFPEASEAQRRGGGADDRGSPAVSLEVGSGSSAFVGLWARLAEQASLGVEADLAWAREEVDRDDGPERTFTSSRLGLGPSLKFYLDDGSVAPFLYGHVGVSRVETETEAGAEVVETSATQLLARAAVGLEWFASSRFSVGGNVGVRWRSWEEEAESAGGGERELDRSSLNLFTSGVSLTFHF